MTIQGFFIYLESVTSIEFGDETIKLPAAPLINHPIIAAMLECVKEVLPELFNGLLVDTIKNCIN